MSNPKINVSHGRTAMLRTPIEENGKVYPFVYASMTPDETRRHYYRVVPPLDPDFLTEAQLIDLFRTTRSELRATEEEQEGHPLRILTVYVPTKDGHSAPRKVRAESGPDLDLDINQSPSLPKLPDPPRPKVDPEWTEPELGGF